MKNTYEPSEVRNHDQIVLGLGEVGSILRKVFACHGYDPLYNDPLVGHFRVMHVIFPFDDNFIRNVEAYRDRYTPDLIIVHSTVPIGTTKKIPHAVHSPVNGRWNNMEHDIRAFAKWVGANTEKDAAAAIEVLEDGKLKTHLVSTSTVSEALKLLCLSRYGVDIAFSHYAENVMHKVGGTTKDFLDWTLNYNAHVSADRIRPVIYPHGNYIQGHCVCPVTAMLSSTHPHPFLNEVLKFTPPDMEVWPIAGKGN